MQKDKASTKTDINKKYIQNKIVWQMKTNKLSLAGHKPCLSELRLA